MTVIANAPVRITAFSWVPSFARGHVRDLRVRWALEEADIDYSERLIDPREARPAGYFAEQPFGQVPSYTDPDVTLFESGAIVLHVAQNCEMLLPTNSTERARATAWVFAALNSIEVPVQQLGALNAFHTHEAWAAERRPQLVEITAHRLDQLQDHIAGRDWLENRFTAGDLMMATVLRIIEDTDLVSSRPLLAAYQARCLARPAFKRALAAQMAGFESEAA